MVEQNIYNLLIASTTLTAKVPALNIGWVDVLEDIAIPKIQFKVIDRPILYDSPDMWERWRFYIVHPSKLECVNVSVILTGLLHTAYGLIDGTYFDYIAKILESPLELRDDNQYEIYLDFRVLYH